MKDLTLIEKIEKIVVERVYRNEKEVLENDVFLGNGFYLSDYLPGSEEVCEDEYLIFPFFTWKDSYGDIYVFDEECIDDTFGDCSTDYELAVLKFRDSFKDIVEQGSKRKVFLSKRGSWGNFYGIEYAINEDLIDLIEKDRYAFLDAVNEVIKIQNQLKGSGDLTPEEYYSILKDGCKSKKAKELIGIIEKIGDKKVDFGKLDYYEIVSLKRGEFFKIGVTNMGEYIIKMENFVMA